MSSKKQKIALFGATGYIGRSLIGRADEFGVFMDVYSHDVTRAKVSLDTYGISANVILPYDVLLDEQYDVIINTTGVGSPKKLSENPMAVFSITEDMDTVLLRYLKKYPTTRVFNISSGAVYGISAGEVVTHETKAVFDLQKDNGYSVAKFASEVKHRLAKEYSIVDLRVFAFVSRWLDPSEPFFICEVAKCLRTGSVFHTTPADMIRDYASADGLWSTIIFLSELPPMNIAFDIRSQSPVGKFVLLEHLKKVYGLKYDLSDIKISDSLTGEKSEYYSKSSLLTDLGYVPKFTALENIDKEIGSFMGLCN